LLHLFYKEKRKEEMLAIIEQAIKQASTNGKIGGYEVERG